MNVTPEDTAHQAPRQNPTIENVVLRLEGGVIPADDAPVRAMLQAARQHDLARDLTRELLLRMSGCSGDRQLLQVSVSLPLQGVLIGELEAVTSTISACCTCISATSMLRCCASALVWRWISAIRSQDVTVPVSRQLDARKTVCAYLLQAIWQYSGTHLSKDGRGTAAAAFALHMPR